MSTTVSWDDFQKIQICVGTILEVEAFSKARLPAYKLKIDVGQGVVKYSSAQITALYSPEQLIGKQIICVVNFPPKNIAGFLSEVLVTGFYKADGTVVLAVPDQAIPNGSKLA